MEALYPASTASRSRFGQAAEWSVVGVGLAFLAVVALDLLLDNNLFLEDLLERAIPLVVGSTLVAAGVWLRHRGVDGNEAATIALGSVSGGALLVLFDGLLLFLISLGGSIPDEPSYIVLNSVAIGLVGGGLLTLQYHRLERQKVDLQKYETIIETIGDPIYALDGEGRYTFANEPFVEQTGYDEDELIGAHVSKVLDESQIEQAKEVITDLLDSERDPTATFEMERTTASGECIPVETTVAVIRSPDGEFRGTVGVIRDISDRKEWERRLQELAAASQGLVESTTEAELYDRTTTMTTRVLGFGSNSVRELDEETGQLVVVARSDESAERLGDLSPYDPETTPAGRAFRTGEVVVDSVPDDDRYGRDAITAAAYAPIGEYGVLSVGTTVGSFDDDDLRLIEILAANVRAARDRLRRESELKDRNERLEQFASIVSHDLRNPLNVLSGSLELAEETGEPEQFRRCHRAIDRMESLIADLLTLARSTEQNLQPEPVDLGDVVNDSWRTVETADATLTVEDEGQIEADRTRLRQLLENLFRNAVEHGTGDVTVTVGRLQDGFYVEDDGPGIFESERQTVFEFGSSTNADGTGLGLYIVERIVDAHDWDVRVTDGSEGGARFEITGIGWER